MKAPSSWDQSGSRKLNRCHDRVLDLDVRVPRFIKEKWPIMTRGWRKLLGWEDEGHDVMGSQRLAPARPQRLMILLPPTLISVNVPNDSDWHPWCFPSFALF
jgi:hypothetical protein